MQTSNENSTQGGAEMDPKTQQGLKNQIEQIIKQSEQTRDEYYLKSVKDFIYSTGVCGTLTALQEISAFWAANTNRGDDFRDEMLNEINYLTAFISDLEHTRSGEASDAINAISKLINN